MNLLFSVSDLGHEKPDDTTTLLAATAAAAGLGGKAVIKPLPGSKGRNVFIVDGAGDENLNQIIDAVRRDGYVVAQEHLPEGAEGDTRLYLLDGDPLEAGDC